MATTDSKTTVSAQVDQAVRRELERLAAEADRTLSAEIRRTLIEHVRTATDHKGGA